MRKLTAAILALSVITGVCFPQKAGKNNINTKRILWADAPVIIDLTKTTIYKYYDRGFADSVIEKDIKP